MGHSHASLGLAVHELSPLGDVWSLVKCVGCEVCSTVSALCLQEQDTGQGREGNEPGCPQSLA